ncbi:hypothetical protein BH24ACT22_BH24ACT22_04910 [soil metagenome]
MWTPFEYCGKFENMFRKFKFFSGKHAHVLPWTIASIGLLCLSTLAYSLDIALGESGGKVATVMKPHIETIEPPGVTSMVAEVAPPASGQELPQTDNCDNLLLMVGSNHVLKSDYVPPDLTYLSNYGISARGAEDMLREEVAAQLGDLISAAAEEGVEVLAASGYRSYWEQNGTFEWFKDAYGEDAGKLSVPPGQSEHQLGTAVDFASSESNYELVPGFARTSAGRWLNDHATQYGFILSYTEDRESDTGVSYEPWHYRYIGIEKALEVESSERNPMSFYREGASPCYSN